MGPTLLASGGACYLGTILLSETALLQLGKPETSESCHHQHPMLWATLLFLCFTLHTEEHNSQNVFGWSRIFIWLQSAHSSSPTLLFMFKFGCSNECVFLVPRSAGQWMEGHCKIMENMSWQVDFYSLEGCNVHKDNKE